MNDTNRNLRPSSGPFGMGWQGYIIIAIIILGTALFASTRRDWMSLLISALLLPLIMVALIHMLSRFWRNGAEFRDGRIRLKPDAGLLDFLSRTNPFMFLLVGTLSRSVDEDRYQELLRSGPYGMGRCGYLITLVFVLGPVILAIIIMGFTSQPLSHSGLHFSGWSI